MFIGEQAATYDKLCTHQAGFVYPGDNKHRIEIAGSDLRLTDRFFEIVTSLHDRPLVQVVQTTWQDILHFPELAEAYPNIMALPVLMCQRDSDSPQTRGQVSNRLVTKLYAEHFYAPDPVVQIFKDIDALDVAYHEMQHVVQAIEGFSAGSNPRYEFTQISQRCMAAIDMRQKKVAPARTTNTGIDLRDRRKCRDYEDVLHEALQNPAKYCTSNVRGLGLTQNQEYLMVVLNHFAAHDYEQRPGEIEARTSASRCLFEPDMRLSQPPYPTPTAAFVAANDNGAHIAYDPREHDPVEELALREHKLLRLPQKRLAHAQLYLGHSR